MSVEIDPRLLRRAAEACRNIQKQARPKNVEWFDWVPDLLDKAADLAGAPEEGA